MACRRLDLLVAEFLVHQFTYSLLPLSIAMVSERLPFRQDRLRSGVTVAALHKLTDARVIKAILIQPLEQIIGVDAG